MSTARVSWDGVALVPGGDGPGRAFSIDPACLDGARVPGAFAHVCALPADDARLRFDEPEVQQVRRDALAWWIPLLGEQLVCLSTFALDASYCGGAVTVARDPGLFSADPFARLFSGTVVEVGFFCAAAPPAGPVVERYGGAPWPAAGF